MYKLEFGQKQKKTAYIFEVDEDGYFVNYTPDDPWWRPKWIDITGATEAVTIRYDEDGGTNYFPAEITKTSVQLRLIRTDKNPAILNDLISGEDNNWRIVITEGDSRIIGNRFSEGSPFYPIIDGEAIFYGILTNETYGEDYTHFANINLTFHDRLGELSEMTYEPASNYQTIPEIFHTCLQGLPIFRHLRIEFPYTHNGDPLSPSSVMLDVSTFVGEKRNKVLKAVLKAFGLSMFIQYKYQELTEGTSFTNIPFSLNECGWVQVRHLGKVQDIEHSYYRFESDQSEYKFKELISWFTVPRFIPDDFKIIKKGAWQLIRRAKYLDAKNDYKRRKSLFYPSDVNDIIMQPVDKFETYTNFYADDYEMMTKQWIAGGWPWSWLAGGQTGGFVPVAQVGNDSKLGLKLADRFGAAQKILSPRGLVMTGDAGMSLSLEVFNGSLSRSIDVAILAYSPLADTPYMQYNHSTKTWNSYPEGSGNPTYNEVIAETGKNQYAEGVLEEIPQPPFLASDYYYIVVEVKANGGGLSSCFVTSCMLSLDGVNGLPPSILIRTMISETRRSPIEEKFEFYNLPNVFGDQSFLESGIYHKDAFDGNITAPQVFGYENNEATMLVHCSELIGGQMTAERWKFKATIIDHPDITEEQDPWVSAAWSKYFCEIIPELLDPIEFEKYYERATRLTVTRIVGGVVVATVEYNILNAFRTEFDSISSLEFRQMSLIQWQNRLDAFRAYVSTVEGVSNIAAFETNLFRRENSLCGPAPDPPDPENSYTIQVQVDWMGDSGSLSGLGGYIDLLNSINVEQDTYAITQYSKRVNTAFTQLKTNPCKVDLSNIASYTPGTSGQPLEVKWREDGVSAWTQTDITGLYDSNVQLFVEISPL